MCYSKTTIQNIGFNITALWERSGKGVWYMPAEMLALTQWVHCPKCGSKTRLRLRQDTVLIHFPLFCPKCRQETLIDAREFRIWKVCGAGACPKV